MQVLITVGSGLTGRKLSRELAEKGYSVAVLTREKTRDGEIPTFWWDPEKREIESGAVENADFIIHLAGANISEKRWTDKRKSVIVDSRVSPDRIIQAGYQFRFACFNDAVSALR